MERTDNTLPEAPAPNTGQRAKRGERWKDLERDAARVLGGVRYPRWLDFSESAPDVTVDDFNALVDAKAHARFHHCRMLETLQRKYCAKGETGILVCREPGKPAVASVPLTWLGDVLNELRTRRREVGRE